MIYFGVPAYNEAETVGLSLYKIKEAMEEVRRDYLLLVLDDGSTDETPAVLESYAAILPLRIVRHDRNRGIGVSLLRIISEVCRLSEAPEGDVLVVVEADLTQGASAILRMLKDVEGGADIVIASAFAKGSRDVAPAWGTRVAQAFLHLLLKNLYALKGTEDYLSLFRAYRVALLRRALRARGDRLIGLSGRAGNTELLINLSAFAPILREVPRTAQYDLRRRRSRQGVLRLIGEHLRMVLRFWIARSR